MKTQFQIGDSVTFNDNKIEIFKSETSNGNPELLKYQKLVLAGVHETGIVKECGADMTTVLYEDGWELPIPTKYLVQLEKTK